VPGGRPLGSIEIALRDPVTSAAELEREVREPPPGMTFARAGRFRVRRRDERSGLEEVRLLYLTGEFGLGSNMAFRTAVLQASGGFDEALGIGTLTRGGEDLAMFVRLLTAGHQIGYEPTAITEHQHRATMDDLDRQMHGYGLGFTAMLTAVTLRDPWHLLGLAAIAPAWVKSLRGGIVRQEHQPVRRLPARPPSLAPSSAAWPPGRSRTYRPAVRRRRGGDDDSTRDQAAAAALARRRHAKARAATVRRDLVAVAARTARHGRDRITLHLPEARHREREWPTLFEAACGPPAAAA
jgi:hypothetical protein